MVDKEWLNLVTRDYESDVNRLNSLFKLSGKTKLANHVPPHTYVGNLSSASQEIRTLQSVRTANQIEITVIQNGVKNTIEIAIGQ